MARRPPTGLDVCLVCEQDFVVMVRCTRTSSGTWWLRLRCGGCGAWHETFAPDDAVAALHKAMAQGRASVAEGARSLNLERMGSELEAFSRALELDLIGPDDFSEGRWS